LKTIQVKKGEILQSKGDLNTLAYKVESGLLRSYTIDDKGKEHIYMFAPENWIIADGCASEVPCTLYIDVLENATLQVSSKKVTIENPNIDVSPFLKRLSTLQDRIIMLMSSNAIERYEHFVKTYPDIIQRVPQRMIASYLGITPEALSKVKGEKARAK
jgi:CRP-like cAMP-binding protein